MNSLTENRFATQSGSGVISCDLLTCALLLLAGGEAKAKIGAAFRVLDGDGDGYLSFDEVHKCVTSFTTVLLALAEVRC